MKRFQTLFLAMVAFSVAFAQWAINQADSLSQITLEEIEVLSEAEVGCTQQHPNGCHAGGPGSVSCQIDGSFHVCLGGAGGACTTACDSNHYSCCGLSCSCIPY